MVEEGLEEGEIDDEDEDDDGDENLDEKWIFCKCFVVVFDVFVGDFGGKVFYLIFFYL